MNIFVVIMGKCDTSVSADWMTESRLADYLQPGVKEPYLFAQGAPAVPSSSECALPLKMEPKLGLLP